MAGTEGPGRGQIHLKRPGLAGAALPVHLQALAAEAQIGALQPDMTLGHQAALGDPVLDAIRQEEQALRLDGTLLQDPDIPLLTDPFPAPIEGHPGDPRTRFHAEGP